MSGGILIGMTIRIQRFITTATLEVRFMPGIDLPVAEKIALKMLHEVRAGGAHGAQAHVISRDDHLSISIEDVELSDMTAASYGCMLEQLHCIAERMALHRRR
jgi:hypothetical protein